MIWYRRLNAVVALKARRPEFERRFVHHAEARGDAWKAFDLAGVQRHVVLLAAFGFDLRDVGDRHTVLKRDLIGGEF